jgi:hypothetical protein
MEDRNLARVDPAALMGAAVAAVLTITLAPGFWWWFDSIIGLTLSLVLLAFHKPIRPVRLKEAWARVGAFASVMGLSVVLLVSFPLQEWLVRPRVENDCGQGVAAQGEVNECVASRTGDWLFPWIWAVAAIAFFAWEFWRSRRMEKRGNGF